MKVNKLNYISIFFLLYFSSSFYGLSIKGIINITLCFIISLITFLLNMKQMKLDIQLLIITLVIVISSLLTMLLNSENIYNYLIFWIYLLCAYLVVISINIREFILIYNNIMYFLAIYSIITFAILLINSKIYSIFPLITNNAGYSVHNILFSVVEDSRYFHSNYGMFWEPGAYQTFLNLALFFQLYIIKEINIKRILVFLLTIATTFSTTGYIGAILIVFIFIMQNIKRKNINIKDYLKRRKMMSIFVFVCIIGSLVFISLPGIIKFKVFGKLKALFNPELINTDPSYISTRARVNSIILPLVSFIKSPIWGVGFDNLITYAASSGSNFLTATPINWFALFGLPVGILMSLSVWRWSKYINNGVLRFFAFTFLIIIVMSENYNRNSFYLAFLLYGLSRKKYGYN